MSLYNEKALNEDFDKANMLSKLSDSQKTGESIKILREVNSRIKESSLHEFTYILYDIRTLLGNEEKTFLEIGSYVGSSASLILQHTYKTNVICVDPCELDPVKFSFSERTHFETLEKNLKNNNIYNNKFAILKNYSTDQALLNKLKKDNTKVDILFIDGDHSYQGVLNDWNNFKDFVNPGGFICFDDYYDDTFSPQVRPAVDRIVENLDKNAYKVVGCLENIHKLLCDDPRYKHPGYINEFIIYKTLEENFDDKKNLDLKKKLFNKSIKVAVITQSYYRKNNSSKSFLKKIFNMLEKQTYKDFKVFITGDNYQPENEFMEICNEYKGEIYIHNNNHSCRDLNLGKIQNYWCVGGIHGQYNSYLKAKEEGYDIALMLDDDDYWSDSYIANVIYNFAKYPETGFMITKAKYLDTYLPRDCNISDIYYNNYIPTACDSVRSATAHNIHMIGDSVLKLCKELIDEVTKLNLEYYKWELYPTDAHLLKIIGDEVMQGKYNSLYIPTSLVVKDTDCNWESIK